jgi:hypothetical protein
MDYDHALSFLISLVSPSFPHAANLKQKLNIIGHEDRKKLFSLCTVIEDYAETVTRFRASEGKIEDYHTYIDRTDNYLSMLRSDGSVSFSHQSDFISSVLPELYCQIFEKKLSALNANKFIVSGQIDLPIDFQIINSVKDPILFKSKRVDVAVYRKTKINVFDKKYDFIVPIVAVENKVNLDKNMLYGIINTAASVKRIFPNCCYLTCTEFADLTLNKHNYAYSKIDQVFTLRKQKRADYRRTKVANSLAKYLIMESVELLEKRIGLFEKDTSDLDLLMVNHGRLVV